MEAARVAGAVLTGGASRRMGHDKAALAVHGVPMALRAAAALRAGGCDPVFAVGGAPAGLGLTGIADLHPGAGPLGGVLTALAHTAPLTGAVVVVACDMPRLDATTIAALIAAAAEHPEVDVVHATSAHGRAEPLCALWRSTATPVLAAAFERGARAVHEAIAHLHALPVAVDPTSVTNVNTPDDLAALPDADPVPDPDHAEAGDLGDPGDPGDPGDRGDRGASCAPAASSHPWPPRASG